MKSIITLVTALLLVSELWAQAPDKMTYQSVIRDGDNDLVKSSPVGLRISVLQGSATGIVVYEEAHATNTNANGLVSIQIGDGAVTSGDLSTIDWSAGPYFIQTEIDPEGGSNYSIVGVSELLSVPFALYSNGANSALNAAVADSLAGGESDPVFGASIANGITAADTALWNDHTVDTHIDSAGIAAYGYVAGPHLDEQTLSLAGSDLSILNGNSVDLSSIDTDDQTLTFSGTTLSIADGNSVNLSSLQDGTGTDDQNLTLTGTSLAIEGGNSVDLSSIDTDTDTDDQTLSLSGTNLTIADGNTVDLSSIDTDTDDQTLTFSGTTLSIADGNSVNLSSLQDGTGTDDQNLTLTGTSLAIEGGNSVDLSSIDTDTDDQTLTFSGTTLSIADGNSVNLSSLQDGTGTDDQNLTLSGMSLSIEGGNSVDLSSIDTDTDTDDQTLSLSGTNLTIADGNTVDLSSIDTDTDDQTLTFSGTTLSIADGNSVNLSSLQDSTGTDDQNLTLSGTSISIEGGNSVDLSSIDTDTDDQTLTLSGTTLSIADGNNVDLSSIDTDTDDQNLSLSGNTLSIDDGNSVDLSTVVAGADKQVTFNDGGSAGADGELVYDKTSNHMAIGTSTVNTSAALEINSTSGGLLLPRMTEAQRDALTAQVGMVIFNTDSGTFQGYAGYPEAVNVSYSDASFQGNLSLAGQSFTATADGSWTKLQVNFTSAVTGGTLQIFAGSTTSGTPIHTQSYTVGSGEQEIVLTTPIQLTSGNQYSFYTGEICAYYPFGSYSGGTSFTSTISFPGNLWFKIITGDAEWVDLH